MIVVLWQTLLPKIWNNCLCAMLCPAPSAPQVTRVYQWLGPSPPPTPRKTQFPHFVRQAESSAVLYSSSPITIPPPARTFCAALSGPSSSNPRQNGSWQIVMCDGRLQTKADLVYAQDFVPKSRFLVESGAKITSKGSSKSLKKSHPMCSCGPRCPSHYRNDQRKAYWLEINLNFIHSCSRNMYDFNFIPCVAWNVGSLLRGRKLSLPKVRHLRSPYPSLIFRRIPSCRTSAPSPLTV